MLLTLFERSYTSQKARLRNLKTKLFVKDIILKQGTLVSIIGMNKMDFQYEVPKTSAKISESIGRKITLCFTQIPAKISPGTLAQHMKVGQTPSFGGINFGNILSSGLKQTPSINIGQYIDRGQSNQVQQNNFLKQITEAHLNNSLKAIAGIQSCFRPSQGRDRAYSSQSGFLMPTISQQTQE